MYTYESYERCFDQLLGAWGIVVGDGDKKAIPVLYENEESIIFMKYKVKFNAFMKMIQHCANHQQIFWNHTIQIRMDYIYV